jgi:hypothetical protein
VSSLFQVSAGELLEPIVARSFCFTKQLTYIHRKPRFAPSVSNCLFRRLSLTRSGGLEKHPSGRSVKAGIVAFRQMKVAGRTTR